MNLTDDELATDLQARAAAVAPHATWDVPAVIAAGRRRRVLRGAGAAGGLAVVALAAALVLPGTLGRDVSAPPADTSTDRPVHVDLAPGVVAAVGVVGPDGDVLLGELGGMTARIEHGRMGPGGPTEPPELVLEGSRTESSGMLSPQSNPADALLGAAVLDGEGTIHDPAVPIDPSRAVIVLAGTVPADLDDGRAFLYSPVGFAGPDGTTTHVVEIPTFRAPESVEPSAVGRAPWFTVELRNPRIEDIPAVMGRMVFASGDGSTVVPNCQAWGAGRCPTADAPGLADEVRAALGH